MREGDRPNVEKERINREIREALEELSAPPAANPSPSKEDERNRDRGVSSQKSRGKAPGNKTEDEMKKTKDRDCGGGGKTGVLPKPQICS